MVLSGEVGGGGALTPNTADGRDLSTSAEVGHRAPHRPKLERQKGTEVTQSVGTVHRSAQGTVHTTGSDGQRFSRPTPDP